MKKILLLTSILFIAISLCSCDSIDDAQENNTENSGNNENMGGTDGTDEENSDTAQKELKQVKQIKFSDNNGYNIVYDDQNRVSEIEYFREQEDGTLESIIAAKYVYSGNKIEAAVWDDTCVYIINDSGFVEKCDYYYDTANYHYENGYMTRCEYLAKDKEDKDGDAYYDFVWDNGVLVSAKFGYVYASSYEQLYTFNYTTDIEPAPINLNIIDFMINKDELMEFTYLFGKSTTKYPDEMILTVKDWDFTEKTVYSFAYEFNDDHTVSKVVLKGYVEDSDEEWSDEAEIFY